MKLARHDPPAKLRVMRLSLPQVQRNQDGDSYEPKSPLLRGGQGREYQWPGQGEAEKPEPVQPLANRWTLVLLVLGMLACVGWGVLAAEILTWIVRLARGQA